MSGYSQENLSSNIAAVANFVDANLTFPTGIVVNNKTIWSSNRFSSSTSQHSLCGKLLRTVTVPGTGNAAEPTSLTFNPNPNSFFITNSSTGASGPAKLIVVT